MSTFVERRRYDIACPIARALDMIGERWTLLILRELLPGPLRFSEIKAAVFGINATILSRRLDQLREGGMVRMVEGRSQTTLYAATPRAESLWPTLLSLAVWGATPEATPAAIPAATAPKTATGSGLTAAASVIAFVALLAPVAAIGFTLAAPRLEWLPEARFPIRRGAGLLGAEVVTTPELLMDLATGRLRAEAALASGTLSVTGQTPRAFLDTLPA